MKCSFQAGDKLPTTPLFEGAPTNKVTLADVFGNKKGVLFAVPGAFTPGCSKVSGRRYPNVERFLEFLCVVPFENGSEMLHNSQERTGLFFSGLI